MKIWGLIFVAALIPDIGISVSFQKVLGIDDVRIRRVAVSPADPTFLAVASENTLYISEDNGNQFRKAANLMDEQISHIFITHDPNPIVYMAGTRHCYRVGQNTERIFSSLDEEEINFIYRHDQHLYIATSKGLYFSEESTRDWKQASGLKGAHVYSVEGFGNNIYLATDGGVFLYRPEGILRRLFVVRRD
jgi:ligand-binding sensor domain-containing protein